MTSPLEKRVSELEARVDELEEHIRPVRDTPPHEKELSLVEFSQGFDTSSHRKKAMVIGYYLERHGGHTSFGTVDLREAYRRCKWPAPVNPSDIIYKCARRGDMMEVDENDEGKQYVLTQTGEDYVTEELKTDE